MLDVLYEVEKNLHELLQNGSPLFTMYIDYEKPFVSRVWFQYDKYRVYLHKIEPCEQGIAYLHPHPWKSAIRIIQGNYEMGVGHSETNDEPIIDCKLILAPGTCYEMIEPNAWHYVRPIHEPVYSLMVTGDLYDREMPKHPEKKHRVLTVDEAKDVIDTVIKFYEWHLN